MIAVLQRVDKAFVTVEESTISETGRGLAILLGISQNDTDREAIKLVEKAVNLRIFPAASGSSGFDQSILDIEGEVLLVSQFTLCASVRKGRRPGFTQAAHPDVAEPLFNKTAQMFRDKGASVKTGVFGAMMTVHLANSGPATFILDTDHLA